MKADAERTVCRCVASAEAWAAECSLYDCTGINQCAECAVFHESLVHWHRSRVNIEQELAVAGVFSLENVCRSADIFIAAARATGDYALINVKLAVDNLVFK